MPRAIRHWTPRYIANRLALAYHERVAPLNPWLTKTACSFLADWLKPSDEGLEWGCGRSTVWFASRVRKLTSVEHNPAWYEKVYTWLQESNISNVDLRLLPTDSSGIATTARYVEVSQEFGNGSLDFVLVDGQLRSQCAQAALARVKPGGLLVIDNANWFIPHASHSPGALARTGAPAAHDWQPVLNELSSWRLAWTSNGVTDTAIYSKPVAPSSTLS